MGWQHDFGNTVFQMWFVVMLIFMALLSAPLRHAMLTCQGSSSDASSASVVASLICWPAFAMAALLANGAHFATSWGMATYLSHLPWFKHYAQLTENLPLVAFTCSGVFLLCFWALYLGPRVQRGLLAWLLLAFLYISSCLAPYHQGCHMAR